MEKQKETITVPKVKSIDVQRVRVNTDPSVEVFPLTITYEDGGGWNETFTDEDKLECFVRGMRAALGGRMIPDFEIPTQATNIDSE